MLRATMQVVEWQTGSEIESNKSSRVEQMDDMLSSRKFRCNFVSAKSGTPTTWPFTLSLRVIHYNLQCIQCSTTLISMKNNINIKINIWFIYQILNR
jgi:hypothetical protein